MKYKWTYSTFRTESPSSIDLTLIQMGCKCYSCLTSLSSPLIFSGLFSLSGFFKTKYCCFPPLQAEARGQGPPGGFWERKHTGVAGRPRLAKEFTQKPKHLLRTHFISWSKCPPLKSKCENMRLHTGPSRKPSSAQQSKLVEGPRSEGLCVCACMCVRVRACASVCVCVCVCVWLMAA